MTPTGYEPDAPHLPLPLTEKISRPVTPLSLAHLRDKCPSFQALFKLEPPPTFTQPEVAQVPLPLGTTPLTPATYRDNCTASSCPPPTPVESQGAATYTPSSEHVRKRERNKEGWAQDATEQFESLVLLWSQIGH